MSSPTKVLRYEVTSRPVEFVFNAFVTLLVVLLLTLGSLLLAPASCGSWGRRVPTYSHASSASCSPFSS